jgi:hypothetical protein
VEFGRGPTPAPGRAVRRSGSAVTNRNDFESDFDLALRGC